MVFRTIPNQSEMFAKCVCDVYFCVFCLMRALKINFSTSNEQTNARR